MIDVVIAGVGGQGTVLSAKVLAVAAASRGWNVRTAETIGMAQRGGSVVSHVRMANDGEEIHSPMVAKGTADLIIAFEPGEAARSLPYLSRTGTIVMATTPIEPVSATLSVAAYSVQEMVDGIQLALYNAMIRNLSHDNGEGPNQARLFTVNDMALTNALGGNRKVLNSVMLAEAALTGSLPFTEEELCQATAACVKPQYIEMNIEAIHTAMAFKASV